MTIKIQVLEILFSIIELIKEERDLESTCLEIPWGVLVNGFFIFHRQAFFLKKNYFPKKMF